MIPENPENTIPEIMRRTMFNLHLIDQQATRNGPYEVTQLINSFLGALAHPWEKYKHELSKISMEDIEEQGWPAILKEHDQDSDPTDLGDLLRLMRNGIAHGNIIFLPDEHNEIQAIKLWNTHPRTGKRTWGTIITIRVMRHLLDCFVDHAKQLHTFQVDAKDRSA